MQIVNLSRHEWNSWQEPQFLVVYTTQAWDPALVHEIRERFPDLTIWGLSSYHGVLLSDGYKRGTFAMLFEKKDEVLLKATIIDLENVQDIRSTVRSHLQGWGVDSSEAKSFFIHGTQGVEERTIEAIHDVFTPSARVFGATAGNDKFLDHPYIFLNDTVLTKGVIIVQMLDNRCVCSIDCGGYMPTLKKGVITDVQGRILNAIDHRPAVDVYDEWTNGMFTPYLNKGGMLPRSCALYPLGRAMTNDAECGFWLFHPYFVDAETKSIHLFSEIPEGTEVHLMRGTEASITTHIGNVIKKAIGQIDKSSIHAAMIMFCAGSASIIADGMESVCEQAKAAFDDIPFIGCTTYGEQGRLHHVSQDYHGNMMIEIVLLLRQTPSVCLS